MIFTTQPLYVTNHGCQIVFMNSTPTNLVFFISFFVRINEITASVKNKHSILTE